MCIRDSLHGGGRVGGLLADQVGGVAQVVTQLGGACVEVLLGILPGLLRPRVGGRAAAAERRQDGTRDGQPGDGPEDLGPGVGLLGRLGGDVCQVGQLGGGHVACLVGPDGGGRRGGVHGGEQLGPVSYTHLTLPTILRV